MLVMVVVVVMVMVAEVTPSRHTVSYPLRALGQVDSCKTSPTTCATGPSSKLDVEDGRMASGVTASYQTHRSLEADRLVGRPLVKARPVLASFIQV